MNDADEAEAAAVSLKNGGLDVLEITFRTDAAQHSIARVKNRIRDVTVGAGTVLSETQLDEALAAGADFIVTPGLSRALVARVQERGLPILPGIATASEIMSGLEIGLDCFKFFPAETSGGLAALRAFRQVGFCPTGGIDEAGLAAWLSLPNVRAVGGSWLAPAGLARREMTRLARSALEIARSIRRMPGEPEHRE